MTDLSGAGTRVLLIATATHDGPTLTSVPSVARTAADLRDAFVDRCGVPPDQLVVLLDPPDARTMARAVTEEAQRAESVLVVYFIGHGLLGPGGELYLAARGTDRLTPGLAEHQALSFSSLRQALGVSRASSVVVVLDCCFSGRVSLDGRASVPAFTLAPAHGLYLIGSAEQLALAPPDAVHTAFTGKLLHLLVHGDPRGQPALTLDAVYDGVFRAMRDQRRPLPRRQAGDRSGNLVVAPNPAVPTAPLTEDRAPAPGRCPYPGLDAFGVDDAAVFFGRERMTERVLAAVADTAEADGADGAGPLVLVGPSGSGKTSLLHAGVLARLRAGGLPRSAGWPCLSLTPGPSPLRRLAALLDATAPNAADLLAQDPDHAVALVDQLLADRPDRRLVLLVDQLEELFALVPDPAERTAFLRALTALAATAGHERPRALVVLALRADFYGRAAEHRELLAALRDNQLLIEPMAADELRAAIEAPAADAGLALDDGLADVILHELGAAGNGQPATGALPLLSHALWATWRQRTGSRLTVAGYRAAGGIAQAIATTAEQTYSALDPAGREAVRRVLPRLVRVGQDAADTARPVDLSALVHGLPDAAAAQQAIDRLTEARLLTLDHDTARISHEALLRAWPRLREWVDADRDWLRARQQLTDDAAAWERSDRDPSLLYRGNRLAALRERAAEAPAGAADLEPVPAEFVDTSWRHERRGVRRRRQAVAFLAVLAVLASLGLAGSIVFQRQATQAQDRALARYLALEAENIRDRQPGLAKQLGLLSYGIDRKAGHNAVFNSQDSPGLVNGDTHADDLASGADGRVLAIAVGDAVVLRDRDGTKSGRVDGFIVGPIAVARDGGLLAAATYDHSAAGSATASATVRLWDVTDLTHPVRRAALKVDPSITSIAFSAGGETLFAGASTGEILSWDLADRAAPSALPTVDAHAAQVDSLAVSPQRDLLASTSVNGRAKLWDIADTHNPEWVGSFDILDYQADPTVTDLSPLHRAAFDPTGRLLALPGADSGNEQLHLWEIDDPRVPPRRIESHDGYPTPTPCHYLGLTSIAFSPTNKIVGGCEGGWQLWVYDTESDGDLLPLASKDGKVVSPTVPVVTDPVVFDPGDAHRLLQATDRGVLVWDVSNAGQPGVQLYLPTEPSPDGHMAFGSAGDRRLIAVQTVSSNTLWDVTDLDDPDAMSVTPAPHTYKGEGIALSPDGGTLASIETFEKGEETYYGLRLRRTADPNGPPLATIEDLDNGITDVAFSPTEPIVVVADKAGAVGENRTPPSIRVFDITDTRRPRQITRLQTDMNQLAFSPDGRTLTVAVAPDGMPGKRPIEGAELRSWDLTDPAHPTERWTRRLQGANYASVAYRPDGRQLAVYENNGTLRLWRVDRHRLVDDPVSVTVGPHGRGPIAFSPDGTRLALIGKPATSDKFDYRPEIWDLTDPSEPVRQFHLPPNRNGWGFFPALAFSPDGETLAVARDNAGIDLWDTDPERIVRDLCRAVGDPITPRQWEYYLPGRPYQPPCS